MFLAPKASRQANAFVGLMPNSLGDPVVTPRLLYVYAMMSGLLYGEPIWEDRAKADSQI